MPQNPPAPSCPNCRDPMQFVVVKTFGRKFRCPKCDDVKPMQKPDVQDWGKRELRPPKTISE